MPSFSHAERTSIHQKAREHIEDIDRAESVADIEWCKTYAAGYVAALVATGVIGTGEEAAFDRAIEQAEWNAPHHR